MSNRVVSIEYFSDLLCVWAYIAEIRLDELRTQHRRDVQIEHRFIPIFGSTAERVGSRWEKKGGFAAYAKHVQEAAGAFDHAPVHADVWLRVAPAGSLGPHAFVRAAALLAAEGVVDDAPSEEFGGRTVVDELAWRLRCAFFRDARDIARLDVQRGIAEDLELPITSISDRLADGTALAALAEDHEAAKHAGVTGSPTFRLNEGRQVLYGNVGYRILAANIEELLTDNRNQASWC